MLRDPLGAVEPDGYWVRLFQWLPRRSSLEGGRPTWVRRVLKAFAGWRWVE